ncbi:MAG: biotin/lipoyl-containing protein [Candidatus Eisenbacteria bacterium]
MRYYASVDGEKKEIEIERTETGFRIVLDGRVHDVDTAFLADGLFLSLLVENRLHTVETSRGDAPGRWVVRVHGRYLDVDVRSELEERAGTRREKEESAGRFVVRSPMPGLMIKVAVSAGGTVRAGDPVAVVEAMKMQNELTAERAGRVVEVHVAPGDRVDARSPIAVIEADG